MIFTSVTFLIFFPLVCLGYFLVPRKLKKTFLLVASYYFYMSWNPKYSILILTSTVITFLSGLGIDWVRQNREKFWQGGKPENIVVALSFISNLFILVFFKYFNFLTNSIEAAFEIIGLQITMPTVDVVLPVGISFYTFQALSYTMDVYRNETKAEHNFISYALFVSFFPQLVAGPIERSKNLLHQVNEDHPFSIDNMRAGLFQMLFGFFQKLVISETCAIVVVEVYDNYDNYPGIMVAVATVLFAFQIYCDFGGYSNIARGAARVMGFSLMENFHNPYFADSVADFWHRWHISLSTWFRDYLYIPLGGNRKGKARKYVNVMIVFLISGLWHGANWTFVIWGGLNGAFQVIEDILKPIKKRCVEMFHIKTSSFSYRFYSTFITFVLVTFAWLFFRAENLDHAMALICHGIENTEFWSLFDGALYEMGLSERHFTVLSIAMLVLLTADLMKESGIDAIEWVLKQGIILRWAIYLAFAYYTLIFGIYGPKFDAAQFIYFQF